MCYKLNHLYTFGLYNLSPRHDYFILQMRAIDSQTKYLFKIT